MSAQSVEEGEDILALMRLEVSTLPLQPMAHLYQELLCKESDHPGTETQERTPESIWESRSVCWV